MLAYVAADGEGGTWPGSTTRRCSSPGAGQAAERFGGALPEQGDGALAALTELVENGVEAATGSSGPRFFHFVTGGVTPAAHGADWLASTLDQNAFSAGQLAARRPARAGCGRLAARPLRAAVLVGRRA